MRSLVAAVLATILSLGAAYNAQLLAQPVEEVPPEADQIRASLPEIKNVILSATRYEPGAVDLNVTQADLTVTLINSKLASGPSTARENEAAKIASVIVASILAKPALKTITAIHIDYVTRKADGRDVHIVDKIDFRKNPQGQFMHHIS
jgi:hypothetical protein